MTALSLLPVTLQCHPQFQSPSRHAGLNKKQDSCDVCHLFINLMCITCLICSLHSEKNKIPCTALVKQYIGFQHRAFLYIYIYIFTDAWIMGICQRNQNQTMGICQLQSFYGTHVCVYIYIYKLWLRKFNRWRKVDLMVIVISEILPPSTTVCKAPCIQSFSTSATEPRVKMRVDRDKASYFCFLGHQILCVSSN